LENKIGGDDRSAAKIAPSGTRWIYADAALAERMVREALAKARWREVDLASRPKGHHVKDARAPGRFQRTVVACYRSETIPLPKCRMIRHNSRHAAFCALLARRLAKSRTD